jgi:demethylmenaquinone methyltransferase/2-methoxy-6-polyprenyl-1,4-benzoquinol methylase
MSSGHLAPAEVRSMFNRIAPRYDLMNQLMSLGLHGRWRRRAAQASDLAAGQRALDCCTGTGDLAFLLAQRVTSAGEVVGTDFSEQMLAEARRKSAGGTSPRFMQADTTDLPFASDSFDAATVAFGIRNIPDTAAALGEMVRVVRPDGRVVVLEITVPERLRRATEIWFQRIVPCLGRLVGRDAAAYAYLPASTLRFPQPRQFAADLSASGLTDVRWQTFVGGMVALHYGRVAA